MKENVINSKSQEWNGDVLQQSIFDLNNYRFWISRGKLHRTFLRFYVNWIVYSGVGACAWERRLGDDGGGGVAQNVAKVRDTDRGLGPA